MRNTKKNPDYNKAGGSFKTVGSVLGQMIGHNFSPAVQQDDKMRRADLQYYVGDSRTLLMVNRNLAREKDKLPLGRLLILHCNENALTKQEICDFFNTVCPDVPFKLDDGNLKEVGTTPLATGNRRHTYYAFDLSPYESSIRDKANTGAVTSKAGKAKSVAMDAPAKEVSDELVERLMDEFDVIKVLEGDDEESFVAAGDVSVMVEKYSTVKKAVKLENPRLNPQNTYIFMSSVNQETMRSDIIGVVNQMNDGVDGEAKAGGYSVDDVIELGLFDKKGKKYLMTAVGVGI